MVAALEVEILENKQIAPEFFRIILNAPVLANEAQPGQFVMVKTSQTLDPFLKRPISINQIDQKKGTISLIYQVIGKGTELLTKCEVDSTVEVIGPLGKGFTWRSEDNNVVIVGGGCGIAPLLALAEGLIQAGKEVHVLLGVQTKEKLINEAEFKKLGCNILVATDDGSYGKVGFVTELLIELNNQTSIDKLYCCGPLLMTKQVVKISEENGIPCQISLEERMACGIGACIGCVVKVRDEKAEFAHKKVCHDGPVFKSSEVIFDE